MNQAAKATLLSSVGSVNQQKLVMMGIAALVMFSLAGNGLAGNGNGSRDVHDADFDKF